MPKITAASIALTALAALVLTGCAGTTEPDADEAQETPQATVSETSEVSETPEPVLTAAPEPTGPDATYLAEIRKRTDVATVAQATDEQLLAAGHQACETFPTNPDIEALRLIEGEQPRENGRYSESAVIGMHAAMYLCPEYDPRPN